MTRPKQSFKIQGMDCAEEIAILKREVGPVVGGEPPRKGVEPTEEGMTQA